MVEIETFPKMGRGVVATQLIKMGTPIFTDPVVVIPKKESELIKQTILNLYQFEWSKTKTAICFGWGSMINHHKDPNVAYEVIKHDKTIFFYSLRDIAEGEQLFVDYGYNPISAHNDYVRTRYGREAEFKHEC